MTGSLIEIKWPNGKSSFAEAGTDWLKLAHEVGILIPTGCLGGSCGACEIEINGEVIRACINRVPTTASKQIKVEIATDPFW